MNKEKVTEFIKELIIYFIIITILLFLARTLGWIEIPVLEMSLGLTAGWVIWKVVMMLIPAKK